MKLNHINLGVTEVEPTVALLRDYFGLKVAEQMPQNKAMGFTFDDNGSLISVFRAKDVGYPQIFHVGFLQETAAEVDAMHAKLEAGGFNPGQPAVEHGRYVFYFDAPGGFVIEVSAVV